MYGRMRGPRTLHPGTLYFASTQSEQARGHVTVVTRKGVWYQLTLSRIARPPSDVRLPLYLATIYSNSSASLWPPTAVAAWLPWLAHVPRKDTPVSCSRGAILLIREESHE